MRDRGQTLSELLVIMLALACASVGAFYALRLVEGRGYGWQWLAVIGGIIAGIVAAAVITFVLAVVYTPVERLRRWWRPYPPPCECGASARDYEVIRTPDEAKDSYDRTCPPGTPGLSSVAWECKCGGTYVAAPGRWMRILPDGTVRPYLRHRFWGRWNPDEL